MKIPQCRKRPPIDITSIIGLGLLGACLAITATGARAFSLIGPYASWMDEAKSFRQQGLDIGGPMNLDEGYRWNVPVLTYGFDASFLEYFGSNGAAWRRWKARSTYLTIFRSPRNSIRPAILRE